MSPGIRYLVYWVVSGRNHHSAIISSRRSSRARTKIITCLPDSELFWCLHCSHITRGDVPTIAQPIMLPHFVVSKFFDSHNGSNTEVVSIGLSAHQTLVFPEEFRFHVHKPLGTTDSSYSPTCKSPHTVPPFLFLPPTHRPLGRK